MDWKVNANISTHISFFPVQTSPSCPFFQMGTRCVLSCSQTFCGYVQKKPVCSHHILRVCFAFPITQCRDLIVSLRPLLCSHKMFRKSKINTAALSIKTTVNPGFSSAPFLGVCYLPPSSCLCSSGKVSLQPFSFFSHQPGTHFPFLNSTVVSVAVCLQSSPQLFGELIKTFPCGSHPCPCPQPTPNSKWITNYWPAVPTHFLFLDLHL